MERWLGVLKTIHFFLKRVLEEASASQAGSRKESRLESSGKNKSYDVRIENFDVSFGDR